MRPVGERLDLYLEVLRAESEHPRHCPEPSHGRRPHGGVDQVESSGAELQSERQANQQAESSRSKKARTFSPNSVDNLSAVMSNLIEVADSALRALGEVLCEATRELEFLERHLIWVAGCPCGRGFTPRTTFRFEKIATSRQGTRAPNVEPTVARH